MKKYTCININTKQPYPAVTAEEKAALENDPNSAGKYEFTEVEVVDPAPPAKEPVGVKPAKETANEPEDKAPEKTK